MFWWWKTHTDTRSHHADILLIHEFLSLFLVIPWHFIFSSHISENEGRFNEKMSAFITHRTVFFLSLFFFLYFVIRFWIWNIEHVRSKCALYKIIITIIIFHWNSFVHFSFSQCEIKYFFMIHFLPFLYLSLLKNATILDCYSYTFSRDNILAMKRA